jgi:AraC-like DNA-binding protein
MSQLPYTAASLFRGATVAIEDVRCRPHARDAGPEEVSARPELVLPRAGFFVRHLGRRALAADPAQVVLLAPGVPYRVSHPLPGGDDSTTLALGPALVADLGARRRLQAPLGPAADLLHRQLLRALRAGPTEPFAVEEAALALAAHALALLAPDAVGSDDRPLHEATRARRCRLVARVQELLAARAGERLGLGDLARLAGASPFHLCRVFRRETGVTLARYRGWLRLGRAIARLADGERDLTGLALDLGFADHSHLTRTLRRELGLTPSALRRAEGAALLRTLSGRLRSSERAEEGAEILRQEARLLRREKVPAAGKLGPAPDVGIAALGALTGHTLDGFRRERHAGRDRDA